jgi:hypothetical protein
VTIERTYFLTSFITIGYGISQCKLAATKYVRDDIYLENYLDLKILAELPAMCFSTNLVTDCF